MSYSTNIDNQKPCLKCGENNPAEVAMCWACYTPFAEPGLTATVASGGGAGAPGPAPTGETAPGRASVPSWIYAGGGATLVLALLVGIKVLILGDPAATAGTVGTPPEMIPVAYSSGSSAGRRSAVAPAFSSPAGPAAGAVPAVAEMPFNFVTLPNRRAAVGVMAIAPRQGVATPQQAVGLARYAYSRILTPRHWRQIQVYVMASTQAGDEFKQFQQARQNLALDPEGFNRLAELWPQTAGVCVFETTSPSQVKLKVLYPQTDAGFWQQLL